MLKKIKQNWLLVVLLLFSLTPVIWFVGRPGVFVNGSDTNFPLNPLVWFTRRFFVWNSVASAGTNFASSTAGLFFHFIQVIPYGLGAGLQLTQIISLVFWFCLLVFSSYFLARKIVPKSRMAQLVFVTFYCFNIYLFNTWENVKVANLAVVTALPLLLAILIAYKDKEVSTAKAMFLTAIVAVVASGAGINPAYFFVIVGGLVAFALVSGGLKQLLIMLAVLLAVNSFWIVSTGKQLLFSEAKITHLSDIGFTNWLDSLSQNTSLLNVFRLQGAWDWYATDDAGGALYIPYANNYFRRLPFVVFSIIVTAAAIVGFLGKEKRSSRLKIYFGLLLVTGVFLGAGSHPPTGIIFDFLSRRLPFFSFFRSPWYIFTPWVTLSLAGLMALLFASSKRLLNFLALVLVVGNLIYVYPLVTGKIFRPVRSDSFFVKFPPYVFAAKEWLADQPDRGRIVGYPGDEIERFEWGYNGIESILNLFSPRETLFSNLNGLDSGIAKMVASYYLSLRRGQVEVAESMAAKLGVSTIFEKRDQSTLWRELPEAIKEYEKQDFGAWTFYGVPEGKTSAKIYSPQSLFFDVPGTNIDQVAGILEPQALVVSAKDTVVKGLPGIDSFAGNIYLANNSQLVDYINYRDSSLRQDNAFETRDVSQVTYRFTLPTPGTYQPYFENLLLNDFGIDWSNGLLVLLDGQEIIWQTEKVGDYLVFQPLELAAGDHTVVIQLVNESLVEGSDNVLGFTNRDEKEKYLVYPVRPFNALHPYLVEFDYKNIYGMESIFKVEQKSEQVNYKFQAEKPPFSPEWTRFSFYFNPVATSNSFVELKPSAFPADNPLGTKLEYANITIYKVFTNKLIMVQKPKSNLEVPNQVNFKKINPARYKGEVKGSSGSHVIVFAENYSPDWKIKLTNPGGTAISYSPSHFSANLFANAWYMEGLEGDYNFEIYYQPQRLHNLFLGVSGAALVATGGYFILTIIRKNKG